MQVTEVSQCCGNPQEGRALPAWMGSELSPAKLRENPERLTSATNLKPAASRLPACRMSTEPSEINLRVFTERHVKFVHLKDFVKPFYSLFFLFL